MSFIFLFIIFILVYSFFFFFRLKLVSLLSLEGLMLLIIMSYISSYLNSSCYVFVCLVFSVFMVIDSILGVSLLISESRNNTIFSSEFLGF